MSVLRRMASKLQSAFYTLIVEIMIWGVHLLRSGLDSRDPVRVYIGMSLVSAIGPLQDRLMERYTRQQLSERQTDLMTKELSAICGIDLIALSDMLSATQDGMANEDRP